MYSLCELDIEGIGNKKYPGEYCNEDLDCVSDSCLELDPLV